MAITIPNNGTQNTTVGTAHSLATITSAGVYQLVLDLNALFGTDRLLIREYIKVRSADAERLLAEYSFVPYGFATGVFTPPRPIVHQVRYEILQTAGLTRAIPWAVHKQDSAFVEDSNGAQVTTLGTEHTLGTLTTAAIYALQVDLSNMIGGSSGDHLLIREYAKATSGGTERLLHEYTLRGAQVEQAFQSIPRISAASLRYALVQTEGASRTFNWSIFEVS